MSLNTYINEQVSLVNKALQHNYADLFTAHDSLIEKTDENCKEWQLQTKLSLLQNNPFLAHEEYLIKQEELYQTTQNKLNQDYLMEYQKFCQDAKIHFDNTFWQKELQQLYSKKEKQSKTKNTRISWRLMLDQWRKELDQAEAEWYLTQLNELRQKFLRELEQWLEIIRKLGQQLSNLGLEPGIWFDNSIGNLTAQGIEELKRWLDYLANDETAKEITELLGKMRQIEQSNKIEQVQQTITTQAPVIDVNSKEEIIGLRLGKELEYILPSELALMSDSETDVLFDLKFLESKLMCFELQGIHYQDELVEIMVEQEVCEDEKLGPMILCVDTSGSMYGTPEHIAKAMTLFLGSQAKNQKRSYFVINFSTDIETFEINEQSGIADLIDFLGQSFHGGTDVAPALRYALQLMQQEKYEKADVLIISDFVMGDLSDDILKAIYVQRKSKNKFNSLVIGDAFMSERLQTYFDHEWIYNPYSKNIQELIQFKEVITNKNPL